MARKTQPQEAGPGSRTEPDGAGPPEAVEMLAKVQKLLDEGRPGDALDLIARAKVHSPWATNALGVCQLRLGNAAVALDVFRGLVLTSGGLVLRPDVPTVFKTNYAAALLATQNVSGCLGVLIEVRDDNNPAVQKLREAIRRWKSGLTFWQKVSWHLGGEPARPVVVDFPLGDLV
jgi:hypothetical protein